MKQVAGLSRTLSEELRLRGLAFGSRHPVLAWLVAHAGTLLSLFSRSELGDGFTPYQRLKGKRWRTVFPPFGEVVEFRRRTRDKLESRWRSEVFLGIRRTTSERIVGDADGIFIVQSVRRVPEDQRWKQDLLDVVTGVPWLPNAGAKADDPMHLPKPLTVEPEREEVLAAPPEVFCREYAPRRLYLTRKDLDKYGHTADCPACALQMSGLPSTGKPHTEQCRERLERAILDDPTQRDRALRATARLREAADKVPEGNPKQARTGVSAPSSSTPAAAASSSSFSGAVSTDASKKREAPQESETKRMRCDSGGQGARAGSSLSSPARGDAMDTSTSSKRQAEDTTETLHDGALDEKNQSLDSLLGEFRENEVRKILALQGDQPTCDEDDPLPCKPMPP